MEKSGHRTSDDQPRSSGAAPSPRPASRDPPPLVIVTEQGRHSQASRRIVRAQAARASAAQSRVTRARNREEREGGLRDAIVLSSPPTTAAHPSPVQQEQPQGHQQHQQHSPSQDVSRRQPLVRWLMTLQHGHRQHSSRDSDVAPWALDAPGVSMRLPLALPRGFIGLQQRVSLSGEMLVLLSRTACVDFVSPGVEQRINQLLADLIMTPPGASPLLTIQDHLRVACACLTIFQGQRADGLSFVNDRTYNMGLQAAWTEATTLDRGALPEPKSAEASLWAVFIISVTTGGTDDFFHGPLRALFRDLQLSSWDQVRKVMLDFIYPVSVLEEPCRAFYQSLPRIVTAP